MGSTRGLNAGGGVGFEIAGLGGTGLAGAFISTGLGFAGVDGVTAGGCADEATTGLLAGEETEA